MLTKQDKLNFIKNFSKITVSSICKDNNISSSNLWRGNTSSNNIDIVYISILENVKKIIDEIKNS